LLNSDGTSLFLLTNGQANLDILSYPIAGGQPTDVAMNATGTSGSDFDHIVVDDTSIYWSSNLATTGYDIKSVAKTGGTPALLANVDAFPQLVLDGTNIYVLTPLSLYRIPKAGGTPTRLAAAPSGASADSFLGSLGNAVALAVDDTWVYWTFQSHLQILKIAK